MKKTVLITGASRGIGRAIAVAFAKAGYNLVITCSKSETELLHLKNDLERDYSVDVLASIGDISDFEDVTQLFSHIEKAAFSRCRCVSQQCRDLLCRSAN